MDVRRLFNLVPLAMLAFILFSTHPARASTQWFVSPTGDNTYNCLSASTPCRTIQAAIDKAGSGDFISAAAGTYSASSNGEMFPINITKNLGIWGFTADTTIIDANGNGQNIFHAAGCALHIVIGDFTIRGGNRGIELIGDHSGCILGEISQNKITANSTGIFMQGSISNFKIWLNDISGNSTYGIYNYYTDGSISQNGMSWNGNGSSAAIFNENADSSIINNVIGWNNGSGVWNDHSSPIITNNTIAFNYGGSGIANWNSSSPALTNNIIVSNGVYGIFQDGTSSPTKTYNDVWGNLWSDYYGTVGGTGSISADPRFVSLLDGHLLCSSPAINMGNNSAPYVPYIDFDANPRPVGGFIDMGAFEKQSDLYCPVLLPVILR